MYKTEIIEMEVIMVEVATTKEHVEKVIKYWGNIIDELDRRAVEYANLVKVMKSAEEERKRKRDDVDIVIIRLNLRGQVFHTTKDILLNFDDTYFTSLLSSDFFVLNGNGEFFIDRNGHCFDKILDYMRTGELHVEGLNS
jgi:hypothetical protein